jgi:RNA polymerase sigma-70 factor (ECF subfamily)
MRRAGAGEPEAQRLLITRLMGRANRLARALLRNRQDAFDASQASLLGILRYTSTFRGESSLECWADRIVVRTSLRLSRRSRRDQVSDFREGAPPSIMPGSEARVSAAQYLGRLSEPQRTALLLRSGFGYSVEEISELTQTPENTVKDRLKRARNGLRRQLERERYSDGIGGMGATVRKSG